MYIPSYFRVTDEITIKKFIGLNSFATLISQGTDFPLATHIPIELEINKDGKEVLWGHVAKSNPHWRSFEQQPNVLVVFMSHINKYISSSWYNYPEAPTWNYMSVQVSGKIKIVDPETSWESVRRLTDKHEKPMACPVALDKLPKKVQAQMDGLVAFEIEVIKIEAAFKMSQNRDEENFNRIIAELQNAGDPMSELMAEMMYKIRHN